MSLRSLTLLWLFVLCGTINAAETTFQFEDPEKQKAFLELTAELRCPMCQNQSISDSNAMIALDLKRKVYDLVAEGKSKQEVIDYMKQRYGEFVHYHPPITPVTIWLWLLPVLFVLVASGVLVYTRMNAVRSAVADNSSTKQNSGSISSEDEAKADQLLDKYK